MTYDLKNMKIAVVGLGYVGMPLALALARYGDVTGYDVNEIRVDELRKGWDSNREIPQKILRTTACGFTCNLADIADADIYIVTVPTPINRENEPDLGIVKFASADIGSLLKPGNIVVYESTVYPGVTENICGPILEEASGLKSIEDFVLGYSPERINPGDEQHSVENITKIVAAQTPDATDVLVALYGQINGGKIFRLEDIKAAEAAKAIENAQRDINIAFVNEVSILLGKLGISTYDVLEAAGTKWNFLPFSPGLVGGHCIGVDPYYLAKSAFDVGYHPAVILAGRKVNDAMGSHIAGRIDHFFSSKEKVQTTNILILGFTFKENINDIRNTKVIDIIHALKSQGHHIDVHDPHARTEEVKREYGLSILASLPKDRIYDGIVLAVAHATYREMNEKHIMSLLVSSEKEQGMEKSLIYDIKAYGKI